MIETQGMNPGAVLHNGTYKIEKVLGQGGFGITYLATDLSLDRFVAIKEFFPKDFCDRDATTSHVTLGTKGSEEFVNKMKAKFLKEARNIAKLSHPGIIKIHAAFEENNTAYYVMEYIEGGSLSEMVKRDGPLSEAKALGYIEKVGRALEYVHARNINHLDVKPANIMIRREDDEPILIDFGLSKQYDAEGNQTSTTPTGISHGYAPVEQYTAGGVKEFSPQADIYSLGATLFYLLSGVVPPQATLLISDSLTFPANIPQRLVPAISKAMSPSKKNRPSSVKEFLESLSVASGNGEDGKSQETTDETILPIENNSVPDETVLPIVDNPVTDKAPDFIDIPVTDDSGVVNNGRARWIASVLVVALVAGVVFLIFRSPDEYTPVWEAQPDPLPPTEPYTPNEVTYNVNGVSFDMVEVEGGSYQMGCDDYEADNDERPVHEESVLTFQIGKTEVTQALWRAVMNGNNPGNFPGAGYPVVNVSWDDCMTFVRKLNELTGADFRLPTEAEWEYAARGGNLSNGYRYSGSNSIGEVAWYVNNSDGERHAVAMKLPNELGLYDMTGNVWEWTSDLWCNDYNSDRTGTNRVFRGGGWDYDAKGCRVSSRFYSSPSHANAILGFRLAK
jgi:formylglycine-generating enzyme required for sulfatase activity/predicted Ser/Thr protein kinase